jgi:hypothetical protein
MPESLSQQASSALQPLVETLEADGYQLRVEETQSRLNLIVTATADACAECLVPKTVFQNMATMALKEGGVALERELQITYPEGHHQA